VNALPPAVVSGSTAICPGGSASVSVALTGTPPWDLTYTSGGTPVSVSGIISSPYTFNVTPSATATYTVTALSDASCTAGAAQVSGSAVVTVGALPTAVVSGSTAICAGGSATVSVALTGTAPWNLTYTDGTTPVTVSGITTSPYAFNVSPASTSTYTVTSLTDGSCSAIDAGISGSATVMVNTRPTATISGGGTICAGSASSVSVALTGISPWNLTYTNGTTPVTVNGITASPYTFTVSPSASATYTVSALSDASCTGVAGGLSGSAVVTVNALPTAVISGSTAICAGGSATVSVALTGTAPWNLTYTSGGTPVSVSGITASPYTFTVSPSASATYTVTTLSDASCTAGAAQISGSAVVTVGALPTAVVSGSTAICAGGSATVSVALTGTAPWNLTYTDGTTSTSVTGITSSPYTFNVSPASTSTYTVTSLSDGSCSAIAAGISGSATVMVNPRPTATISGGGTICAGGSAAVSVALTGTAPWNLTYTNGTTPVTVNGITASPYIFTVSPAASETYIVTALSDASCTGVAGGLSGSAVVTVNALPTAEVSGSAAICPGGSATISITLTGVPPYSVTYTDGSTSTSVNGIAVSPFIFTVKPTATATYKVTAMSDASCTAVAGNLTGSALVTVSTSPTAVVSGGGPICPGGSATVSVALTGTPPWSLTYTDGTTPTSVTGVTTSPYVFTVSPAAASTYTVTALTDAGCAAAPGSLSGTAMVTVSSLPTAVLSGSASVCAGSAVPLSVALTGTAPWNLTYSDGTHSTSIKGITASPYVFNVSPAATTSYKVTDLTDASCTAVSGDLSGSPTVTVKALPTASISGSAAICSGTAATLSVALTGTGPWNLTYSDGTTPTAVTGITSSPYTFNESPAVSSTYTVTSLTDASCSAGSTELTGAAIITVTSKPAQPVFNLSEAVVQAGTTVAYSIVPNTDVLNYQWSYTGTGVTIQGNTDAVQINFDITATNGNLEVSGVNDCGTGTALVLPITVDHAITEFNAFIASRQGTTALLKWTTQYEFQVDHFDVNYSTDSVHFNTIGSVSAVGNSLTPESYSYVHKHPQAGWNEYQIVAVGKNDSTVSSAVLRPEQFLVADALSKSDIRNFAYFLPGSSKV
jgi:hypothetical protein